MLYPVGSTAYGTTSSRLYLPGRSQWGRAVLDSCLYPWTGKDTTHAQSARVALLALPTAPTTVHNDCKFQIYTSVTTRHIRTCVTQTAVFTVKKLLNVLICDLDLRLVAKRCSICQTSDFLRSCSRKQSRECVRRFDNTDSCKGLYEKILHKLLLFHVKQRRQIQSLCK